MTLKTTGIVLLAFISTTLAFAGEYIPKSYYVIDPKGRKSDVVFFRSKRDVELFPLLRLRRSSGGGGGSSYASSFSSASASAGAGAGGGDGDFDNFFKGLANEFGGGLGAGFKGAQGFAGPGSSSSSGIPGHGGTAGYNGPILFSRIGEDTGTGVHVAGSAQGEKAAFSSSSASVDSDGKIKYSVQSGKI